MTDRISIYGRYIRDRLRVMSDCKQKAFDRRLRTWDAQSPYGTSIGLLRVWS